MPKTICLLMSKYRFRGFAVLHYKVTAIDEQKSSTTMLIIVVYYKIPLVEMLTLSLFGNFSAPM